jgi:hydroxyethylthiazole kinase-like uncharacterized protein yjeF
MLAGVAALRAGAGKLQICTAASVAPQLGIAVPEARVVALPELDGGGIDPRSADKIIELASKTGALLIGPGLLDEEAAGHLTAAVLAGLDEVTAVVDAAAMMNLRTCQPLRQHTGRLIITPHAGEMASILDITKEEVEADPTAVARRAAAELPAIVILKGTGSLIVTPDGQAWCSTHGNPGLGTSGSGDVLAGIITGLLARGAEPACAAIWGVYLHGRAGELLAISRGPLGYLARELPDEIPGILGELCRQC